MRALLWLLSVLALVGCRAQTPRSGVFCTAGEWDIPPAFHGNPWAPGGVGVARRFCYESMFDYTPADGSYFPRLATRFEETPDRLTVHLRRGVLWHDGEPFTAADVVATFNVGYIGSFEIWHYLAKIETPDPHTVVFHWRLRSPTNTLLVLTEPITTAEHLFRPNLEAIARLQSRSGPRNFRDETAAREVLFQERPRLPVGTGPFRLKRVTASDMVLQRFEHYYLLTPTVQAVHIARWGRNEVVWSYLHAGQLDGISPACPYDVAQEVLKRQSGIRLITPSDNNEMGLVLNTRHEPLKDRDFRVWLTQALDRDSIRRLACAVGDTSPPRSLGIVPSQANLWLGPGWAETLPAYPHNPAAASSSKPRLAAPLQIMAPSGFTDLALLSEAAASQLTRLGVPTEVRLVQGELYTSLMQEGRFDIAAVFGSQMGRTVHPSTSYGRFFAPDAQLQRASGVANPEGAALVNDLRLAMDPEQSRRMCRRLSQLQNESLTFIPCFEKRLMIFVQDGPGVTGWPAADSPLWSAAPLSVESLYCSLMVRGLVGSP